MNGFLAFIEDKIEHENECFHLLLQLMLFDGGRREKSGSLELPLTERYQQSVLFLVYIQILRHVSPFLVILSFFSFSCVSFAYRRHIYLNFS